MAAACSLCVIGVNSTPIDGSDCVLYETGLVKCVSVKCDLDVHVVGDSQATINDGWRCAPVLMKFETASARSHLFHERIGKARVALPEETEIHWKALSGLQHAANMPGARGTRRRGCSSGWPLAYWPPPAPSV